MKTKPNYWYNQSAVIPFKIEDGLLKILLITSKKKKKWIIPKGIIEFGYSAAKSAEKEAFEEAGVLGKLHEDSLGRYFVKKWGNICNVEVFALEVTEEMNKWEEDFRQRKWIKQELLNEYIVDKKLLKSIYKLKKHLKINSKQNN